MLNLIFNWKKRLYLPSAPHHFELIFIIRKIVQFFSKNFHKLFIICEKGKQKVTVFWPSNFQCGITLTSFSYLQYNLGVFEEILPEERCLVSTRIKIIVIFFAFYTSPIM